MAQIVFYYACHRFLPRDFGLDGRPADGVRDGGERPKSQSHHEHRSKMRVCRPRAAPSSGLTHPSRLFSEQRVRKRAHRPGPAGAERAQAAAGAGREPAEGY